MSITGASNVENSLLPMDDWEFVDHDAVKEETEEKENDEPKVSNDLKDDVQKAEEKKDVPAEVSATLENQMDGVQMYEEEEEASVDVNLSLSMESHLVDESIIEEEVFVPPSRVKLLQTLAGEVYKKKVFAGVPKPVEIQEPVPEDPVLEAQEIVTEPVKVTHEVARLGAEPEKQEEVLPVNVTGTKEDKKKQQATRIVRPVARPVRQNRQDAVDIVVFIIYTFVIICIICTFGILMLRRLYH